MADIVLSPQAAARIRSVVADEPAGAGLRVAVDGGGCSGFQYEIAVTAAAQPDDLVIERDGARVFIDPVSLPYLLGSEIDWVEEVIGSSFKVKNPNATSSCGCGVSFSI